MRYLLSPIIFPNIGIASAPDPPPPNILILGGSHTVGVDVDWQSKITSDGSTVTTMVAGQGYFVDNSSAAGIVKLPTSAVIGDTIAIKDYAGNFGTNSLTIQRNGHNIQGSASNSEISTNRASVVLVYVDSTKGWLFTDEHNVGDLQEKTFTSATGGTVTTSGNDKIHTFTGDGNFVVASVGNSVGGGDKVSYLVVAGGGGGHGGGGSGGGAGGFREGKDAPISSYTVSPLNAPAGLTVASDYSVTYYDAATGQEVEKENRTVKKEVRETRTHIQFLLDRLEKAHERNAELRKKMMTITFDDVLKTQKELA